MDKTTHVIKRSELPQGVTLEQATADFINSIPRDLFSFDKIEITGVNQSSNITRYLSSSLENLYPASVKP